MPNSTLEKPPVIDAVTPALPTDNIGVQLQPELELELQEVVSTERSLGVLARRAATADYYSLLTEYNNSDSNTVNSWKEERNRWNDMALELMKLNPDHCDTYYRTYGDVFSNLYNPNR